MLSHVHFDKDVGINGDIMDAVSGVRKANRTIPSKVVPWRSPRLQPPNQAPSSVLGGMCSACHQAQGAPWGMPEPQAGVGHQDVFVWRWSISMLCFVP